jgi:hypothetical protein
MKNITLWIVKSSIGKLGSLDGKNRMHLPNTRLFKDKYKAAFDAIKGRMDP